MKCDKPFITAPRINVLLKLLVSRKKCFHKEPPALYLQTFSRVLLNIPSVLFFFVFFTPTFFSSKPPDEARAAWKTPPISPIRPPSASRRRDPDPGGAVMPKREEASLSTRPGKFVSKLRAEAQLASSGLTAVNRPLHMSSSESGLGSLSTPAVRNDQGNTTHTARSNPR